MVLEHAFGAITPDIELPMHFVPIPENKHQDRVRIEQTKERAYRRLFVMSPNLKRTASRACLDEAPRVVLPMDAEDISHCVVLSARTASTSWEGGGIGAGGGGSDSCKIDGSWNALALSIQDIKTIWE